MVTYSVFVRVQRPAGPGFPFDRTVRMPFEIRPHPAFSWSHTRDSALSCMRRYYWQFYGSHNGWLAPPDGSEEARLAYTLKQLTTLHLAAGTAIHECARDCVLAVRNQDLLPNFGGMQARVIGLLRHVCRCSRDREGFLRDPKHHPMLHSMWYRDGFDEIEVRAVRAKVDRCLYHLSESHLWRELPWYAPEEIVVIDKLDTVTVDGVTLYAAPDLVVTAGGEVEITDWKTGKDDDLVRAQIALYAFYTSRKLGIPFDGERWRGRVVWLYDGADEAYALTPRDLVQAEERMRSSVEYMRGYLEDAEENRPKPLSAFPLIHRALRNQCPFCNYLALCEPEFGRARLDAYRESRADSAAVLEEVGAGLHT